MLLQGVHAAELRATVRDEQGRPLRDALVIAVADVPPARPRPRVEQVEQIDLEFVPGVKAILVGTSVSFPNRDDVRHHVYSFSQPQRLELPLYVRTPAPPGGSQRGAERFARLGDRAQARAARAARARPRPGRPVLGRRTCDSGASAAASSSSS